eukprot:3472236-Amphidinium_carterae.2
MQGIHATGVEVNQHHTQWLARSGAAPSSATSHAHKHLCSALGLMVNYDQVDVSNLASAEFLARWLLMLEAATKRNPRAPDFTSLDSYLSHAYDAFGGIVVSDFTKYIADEQKTEAQILKQSRLWREERDAEDKRSNTGPAPKKKGGGGKGDGGAASSASPS